MKKKSDAANQKFNQPLSPISNFDRNPNTQADDLYRLGQNEDSEINTLMAYYRDRINRFENERQETIQHIERIKLGAEERHRDEWEITRAKESNAELQKALSDARCKLYEERQVTLKLKTENEGLHSRTNEDNKRIQELVGIVEPVHQQIVLERDKAPSIVTKFINNDLNIGLGWGPNFLSY